MASVNKVILIGNLGRDPETRFIGSTGAAVTSFSIATANRWKDKQSGETREETEWHSLVCFGRLAEIAEEYLQKGKSVYVEGRLKTEKWQDKEGNDRYTTKVYVDTLQFLGGGPRNDDGEENEAAAQQRHRTRQPAQQRQPSKPAANIADMDDDIPF